jgi:MraZ protein
MITHAAMEQAGPATPAERQTGERTWERDGPGRMSQFLGTHTNKLDAKGRVSIPAPFRASLRPTAGQGSPLVLRPSHKHPCVEGWPAAVFHALAAPLDALDLFGEAHDDLAAALYADAHQSEPDKEGRIVLPADLIAHARLADSVVFLGLGKTFQIWEPEAGERFRTEARERARARGLTLPGARPGGAA